MIMKKILCLCLLSLALISLSGCSLSSAAPKPPKAPIAQPSTQNTVQEPLQLPSRRPNAANGAVTYAAKCVQCHGLQGRGDGPQAAEVKAQTGTAPAEIIGDPIARAQSPQQWFDTITNGRIEKLMPPFGPKMAVDDRWDVIAYIWTLATSPADIERGKAIYFQQCVQCHGEQGKGDGPQAKGTLPNFTQFATFASRAIGQLDQALTASHVPSFAGQLNTSEQRFVNDYIRSLSVDQAAAAPTVSATLGATSTGALTSTPIISGPAPAAATVIEGYIINGTAGQAIPPNSSVNLYVLHSDNSIVSQPLQANAQGRFVADKLPATHGDTIYGEVPYKNLNFFNGPVGYGLEPTATLPITIYEATQDMAAVKIDALHIVALPNATGLQVSEIYVLSNLGDRYVAGFGQPIMHLSLPVGATAIAADPNMTPDVLIPAGDGVDYYDAIPVGSKVTQIVFEYQLTGSSFTLDRPVLQNVDAVNVLLEGDVDQLRVSTTQFANQGAQPIQGQVYQQYSAQNLKPGDNLSLKVDLASGAAAVGGAGALNWPMVLGIGLVVLGLLGIVVWQVRQRKAVIAQPERASAKAEVDTDVLIDQIAALDDLHDAGQIDDASYTTKRTQLKKKLMKVMSDE
jgi:cbb3-type cytochrome c oxidase subunit III